MPKRPSTLQPSPMRPEIDLLLSCARVHVDAARVGKIHTLVHGSFDWDYLLRLAARHRLAPMLYRHLSRMCPEEVAEVVTD